MAVEHYFSQTPETEFKPKQIKVKLAGRDAVVETSGGIFSPDHVDGGTAVLLEHLDQVPAGGNLLDIGCGWGPIALSLALVSPRAKVWAIDVNDRSLELTRRNAKALGLSNVFVCRPEDVPPAIKFQGIWSNPPIRVGKQELHDILLTWLPRLEEDAEAFLVVQKNLGADSLQRWLGDSLGDAFSTVRFDTAKSFRVLRTKHRSGLL